MEMEMEKEIVGFGYLVNIPQLLISLIGGEIRIS
jgi:hypothetical protein